MQIDFISKFALQYIIQKLQSKIGCSNQMIILFAITTLLFSFIQHSKQDVIISDPTVTLTSYQTFASSTYKIVHTVSYTSGSTIGSGSSVLVTFSNRFNIDSSTLSDCKASISSSVAASSVACSVTFTSDGSQVYNIKLSGMYTASSTSAYLELSFTINNPFSASSEEVTTTLQDSSNVQVAQRSYNVEYIASSLTSCGVVSSSSITSQTGTYTLSFTPSRTILANSYLILTMPISFTITADPSFLTCTGVSGSDSGSISCNLLEIVDNYILNFTGGFVTSDRTALTTIQISVSSFNNPYSFQPFGPLDFQLMSGQYLSQACYNNYLTMTQASTFSTLSLALSDLSISAQNSQKRMQVSQNPTLTSLANRLQIVYTDEVTVLYTGTYTVYIHNSTQLTLSGVTSTLVRNISVTTPPSTRPFSFTISSFQIVSGVAYKMRQQTLDYQNSVAALTGTSVTALTYFINQITTYTIKFTLANDLIAGSFIEIIFPSDLVLDTTNSVCSSDSHTCSIVSASNLTLILTSAINADTQVTITVTLVTNANEAKTTDSFKIYTYYDSLYDSLVDQIATGLTVTMLAQTMVSASATPASLVTYQLSTYVIDVVLNDPIPAGGRFVVIFPSSISPQNSDLTAASFDTSSCIVTQPTTNQLDISNCFSAQLTNLNVQLTFSNIRNPPSLKTSLSIQISTYGALSVINYVNSGLNITMATANTITSLGITPFSDVVYETTTYTINIQHVIDIHASGDYLILQIPSLMTIAATPTCNPITGITSISCVRVTTSSIKITYTDVPALSVSINLENMVNYLIGDQPVDYSITIYNSENYQMQKYQNFQVTYAESQLTSITVNNDDNIALGEASNITLTINNQFALYSSLDRSLTQIDISIPSVFTISNSCSSTAGLCTAVTASNFYRVTNVGLSLTNLNITMQGIQLNYFDPESQSFKVQYTYNGFNVSVKQSGVVVEPFCQSPCQRCDVTASACQSCLPAPNTLIYYDGSLLQCRTSCIEGKYPDDVNQCQLCVSPCDYCLDIENCTKCVSGTWLYELDCLTVCPAGFYNASTGHCLTCQSPCDECTTLTACSSCLVGYYTNQQCVNAQDCPTGTYANSSTLVCQSCYFPCSACSAAGDNCTTCETGYLFYDNNCVQSCPDGMYPSSIYCFNCVSPCDTCTNSTYCKSCLTDYLNDGDCVQAADCPTGTYPNTTEMKCKTCTVGCTSCANSTYCLSCQTGYLFYDNQCLLSCPEGTYKSGITCLACEDPCQTCVNSSTTCLSCVSPQLFFQNTCLDSCPEGTYANVDQCSTCLSICQTCSDASTCDSCSGNRYLQDGTTCVTQCDAGYYGDQTANTCEACVAPCSSCSQSPSNCTKCIAPQLQYLNGCVDSCPDPYFQVNGSCKTCPNCVTCLDANTCIQCNPSFYQFNGVCYTNCPQAAPIPDQSTNTCGTCSDTCLACQGLAKNCTSCYSQTFLYKGTCLSECPLGFIQDYVTGSCMEPLIGSVIYFPFFFTFVFCFIVTIVSKCLYPETQTITTLAATISLCEVWSWVLLGYILTQDYTIQQQLLNIGIYVSFALVGLSILLGIVYNVIFCKQFQSDKGWKTWRDFQPSCLYSYRVVAAFSGFSFRFFRFLYSRLFNRTFLSIYIADGGRFLSTIARLTVASLVIMTLPMMILCAILLYNKQIYDQTFFCCLDTLALGFLAAVFLTIDSFTKGQDFFDQIKNSLPFLKYKNMVSDQSMVGQLLSRYEDEQEGGRRARSEAGEKQKDQIFRRINFVDNNKFGHLNVLENQQKSQTKSLPQFNKFGEYPQYDLNNQSEGDRVIDDLYFMEDERKRKEEEEQARRKREEEQRLRKQQQARQEEERRRRLMQQDENERVDLQFPDIVAIDRVEAKNGKDRKNPLQLLSNCKKMDQKKVNDKALKKLQQIGKKNGIDPNFMKETFGVQKNHNPELLNQIIDKHHHVKRQAVKQLFNQNNNPELLQEMFAKNSTMDPAKLREILNDPDSAILIANLADKQNGRLSPEMAKQLFDKNSKFSKQFTKNLLSNDNGMDPEKMKDLLKDSNTKGKDSPLKALKKIGGQNLQNKELLNNMLGQQSKLDPQNFTRVANDLPISAIENIFKNKGKTADIISQKILNNKKINLKDLAPILEDEQLLQELADTLADDGNPNLQQNLLNLFKNAENIDPQKLKQILADPILRQKLLSKPIDPQFLSNILNKDSNTDLKLLSKTIEKMPDESIQETFKFDPEKNIDFANLAKIFDKNPKSDANLISKMLEPELAKELYYKGNDTKMLNKLVQEGNEFDPQVIKNVYGRQKHNFFDTQTQNLFEDEKNKDYPKSQKQYSLGFQKSPTNLAKMSQTAGGMMSFLSPIVPKNNRGLNNRKQELDGDWSSKGEQSDDDGQIKQEDIQLDIQGRRKRKPRLKKLKKKPASDIRLAAQQIYLQRIQAPHEHAMKKANIRKKKKKNVVPGIMDEDNDIFDLDF